MVFLTFRGMVVSRGLLWLGAPGKLQEMETHPGAAMALGGAPVAAIRDFRDDVEARDVLLRWLKDHGLRGLGSDLACRTILLPPVQLGGRPGVGSEGNRIGCTKQHCLTTRCITRVDRTEG